MVKADPSAKIKNKHPVLKFFIAILLVFIVFPIAFAFIFLYDDSVEQLGLVRDTTNNIVNRITIDSLDDANNDDVGYVVKLKMFEHDFNTIINNALVYQQSHFKYYNFVNQAYIRIDPSYVGYGGRGKYTLNFELTSSFFKSKVVVDCVLRDNVSTEDDYTKQYITFSIINVTIGRLSGLDEIAKSVVKKDLIQTLFEDVGLNVEVDMDKLQIKYNLVTAVQDFERLSGNSNMQLYSSLFIDALNQKLINFDFYTSGAVSIDFNLRSFHENTTYEDSAKYTQIDLDAKIADLVSLLNNGIIKGEDEAFVDSETQTAEPTYVQDMFEYLIHGYTYVSGYSGFVQYLSELDLTSIGINDYTAYEGIPEISLLNPSYKDLTACVRDSVSATQLALGNVCRITEEELNNYFRGSQIIGSRTLLYRNRGTSEDRDYKASYVCVDNFYCDILADEIDFVANINVNGYKTTLVFTEKYVSTEDKSIVFDTEDIYLGETEATDSMKNFFFEVLDESFHNCQTFHARVENTQIIIDFAEGINASPFAGTLPSDTEYEFVFDTNPNDEAIRLTIAN